MNRIPELDNKGLRQFALTTGAALALIFGVLLPWLFNRSYLYWPWIVTAILWVWGFIAPTLLRPVYVSWMRIALLISKVTTPIILGIVFFLVIFPVSLIFRLLRNDPMKRRFEDKNQTDRVESEKSGRDSLENPF